MGFVFCLSISLLVFQIAFVLLFLFQVLDAALSVDADEESKRALTRVIVTQKQVLVKEGYVPNKIEGILTGLYKDFILGSLANKPL